MRKQNDCIRSPLRFILDDGTVLGQMYNSWDKSYHLSVYVPEQVPPMEYLCKHRGNLIPSRSDVGLRKGLGCCPECSSQLWLLSGLNEEDFKKFGFFNEEV